MTTTANINVGDTVFGNFTRYSKISVHAGIVKAKSPTGVIRVAFPHNDISFLANGRERGGDQYHAAQLIDEATYDRMHAQELLQRRQVAATAAIAKAAGVNVMASNKADVLRMLNEAIKLVEAI